VHTKSLSILFSIVVTVLSCATGQTSQPNQSILFFKDKDGLYLYDPTTQKEQMIFKASDKQIFLDEPYHLSGDTLTFGIKGELVFVETSHNESGGERYYDDYFSINLKTGNKWLSKKILYEVIGHSTLNIKTLSIDVHGKTTVLSDTLMAYHGSSSTFKGVTYNVKPRFFSKQSVGSKSVFSLRGSIYYTDKSDTTLLVEYKGHFDPKFGSGYFQPQLDPTGQYAVFRYLPGFMNLKEEPSLQTVNIQTKRIEILKTGAYGDPTFSADGKFILFTRGQKQGKLNTWISKIHLLDMTTLEEWKIGDAYSGQWAPKNDL
jgi:hypothetical protein